MNLNIVLFTNSVFMFIVGILMFLIALVDALFSQASVQFFPFFLSSLLTIFIAGAQYIVINWGVNKTNHGIIEIFSVTVITWFSVSIFSALPFYLGIGNISYIDAFFEAVSGFTTTGSTVLSSLENLPKSIIFWRALLQWIGGIGIIIFGVKFISELKNSGMRLFLTESSEKLDKEIPNIDKMVRRVFFVYCLLSFLCFVLLILFGMNLFEAVIHTMATMSTGGFSTSDLSIGYFNNLPIEIIITCFMLLASLPFYLISISIINLNLNFIKDDQVIFFIKIFILATFIISLWLFFFKNYNFWYSLRIASFNIASILSGTGFSSVNYELWGAFPISIMFFLTFFGGCSGSASCGIKAYRLFFCYQLISMNNFYLDENRRYIIYNNKVINDDDVDSVLNFIFMYIFFYFLLVILVSLTGTDLITSFSSVAATISNVGPGFGATVGVTGNFMNINFVGKLLLITAMFLGRLEFLAIIALMYKALYTTK